MRICHINLAKGFRGGERQTLILIEELAKAYPQTIVIRKNNSIFLNKLKEIENLTIIEISKPFIFHILKLKNFDLIHTHEAKASQIGLFSNLIFKIPYLIARRVTFPPKNNFFTKLLYKKSSKVICLSDAIKDTILKYNGKLNIEIIPSAISKLNIDIENIKVLKEQFKDKFLIGNIGALVDSDKGQSYIIEVAKEIEKSYPNIEFIFVGDGKDREKFQKLSQNLRNITFIGFTDRVGDYLKVFDIFLFPSLNEGLGSTLLDAMDFEKPIIATRVGGITDLIKDDIDNRNGILINPKNIEEMRKAILKLYSDKNLREELAKSTKEDSKKYYIENLKDRYIQIYSEIINAKST